MLLKWLLHKIFAPEVLALQEKIDNIKADDDPAYLVMRALLEAYRFQWHERKFLEFAMSKVDRRFAYRAAMTVVVTNELPNATMDARLVREIKTQLKNHLVK